MHIKKATYVISSPDYEKCPAPNRPEFAFIGRSNVGKTSGSPGKTQMLNHFEIVSNNGEEGKKIVADKKWYLVDLPGYGFAKVSIRSRRKWEQMIENYLRKRENLSHLFVLIDARHSPQKIDLEFLENLKTWNISFSLAFTKSDKESQRVVSKNVKDFLEAMKKTWQFLPQHFVTSAVKKAGKLKMLAFIGETTDDLMDKGSLK
jgi:GTP-binding protein